MFAKHGLRLNRWWQCCCRLCLLCFDFLKEVLECLWWSNHMLTYVHWIKVWILWVLTPESTFLRSNDVLRSAWLSPGLWNLHFLLPGCLFTGRERLRQAVFWIFRYDWYREREREGERERERDRVVCTCFWGSMFPIVRNLDIPSPLVKLLATTCP